MLTCSLAFIAWRRSFSLSWREGGFDPGWREASRQSPKLAHAAGPRPMMVKGDTLCVLTIARGGQRHELISDSRKPPVWPSPLPGSQPCRACPCTLGDQGAYPMEDTGGGGGGGWNV